MKNLLLYVWVVAMFTVFTALLCSNSVVSDTGLILGSFWSLMFLPIINIKP